MKVSEVLGNEESEEKECTEKKTGVSTESQGTFKLSRKLEVGE